MKYRPKHVAEYLLLRAFCLPISLLPYRFALFFAAALAAPVYLLMRRRRLEAVRRIRVVMGPSYPLRKARRDAWISFRNLAFSLAEMLYLSRHDSLPRPVDLAEALAKLRAWIAENPGRGGLFACPHMGNWELAGIVAPAAGVDLFTIFAEQKNPLVNRWMLRLRHADSLTLLSRTQPGLLKIVLANLRKGKFLAILPDLRSRNPGVPVPFFGGTVNTYAGLGKFAVQARVPVFLAIERREGWTRHSITLLGPWYPDPAADKDAEAQRLIALVLEKIDAAVRQDPSQYFWYNSRWVLDPL